MKVRFALLAVPALLLGGVTAQGQSQGNSNFYNGVRDGGRGGHYDRDRHDRNYGRDDNSGDRNYHPGGIGPGRGALIGGAGGAALGAVFGGGLKGSLIAGAAGAGIGAIAGQEHQNHERNRYYR